MRPNKDVESLAEQIAQRREDRNPFTLFLGAGCARAAGVPSLEEMAYRVFADYFERDPSLVADYLPPEYWASLRNKPDDERDYEPLLEWFFELMRGMSGIARSKVLRRFYSRIPAPRFYQDLARLLNDRYFSRVLTTNIDTLLEQALSDIGLQSARDYQVISLGGDPSRMERLRSRYDTEAAITIVKLHGDLAQREVALSPEEIEEALRPQRAFVKGELSGGMVVVGYNFETERVNRWLRWTTGHVWWVNPKQPTGKQRERLEEKRLVQYIDGSGARPDEFFGVLLTMLLSMAPAWEEWGEEPWDEWGEEARELAELAAPAGKGLLAPDELEVQYVQDQFQTGQAVLSSLEQQVVVKGGSDVALQVKIDYQRREIAQLEARLRELSTTGTQVVELMRGIANSVRRAGGDPGAVSFLRKQANTVKAEYERDETNQDVVSAAIGATVLLADRLGPDLVDQQAVQALASIAPSAVTGRF